MTHRVPKVFQQGSLIIMVLASLLMALTINFPANAQSGPSGSLTGAVQDPNGAHLPGVNVTVRNSATGATRTAPTDNEGRWTIPGLSVATYQITYESARLKNLLGESQTVEAVVTRTVDAKLEIGEVDAIVNITEGSSLVGVE